MEGSRARGRKAMLGWLAKVRVAGVDATGYALGVKTRHVHRLAAALQADGFVERPKANDGEGAVLAITPAGTREALIPVRSNCTPSAPLTLAHGRGVSWIAAHSVQRGRPWRGPLELATAGFAIPLVPRLGADEQRLKAIERGREPTHLPDLVVERDGERWAVEYERTPKGEARVTEILAAYRSAQLAGQIDGVLYVVANPTIGDLVERCSERAGGETKLLLKTIDALIAEVRSG